MRLLVLGANGRTGQLATSEALKQGHSVTALVRKSSSMSAQTGLTVVEGSPLKQSDVEMAFSVTPDDPITSVLVTLNAARASDSPFSKPVSPPDLIRDSVRNTVAVMKQHNVKKIIVMSANGVGSSFNQMSLAFRLLFRYTNMSYQMQDHEHVDEEVRASEGLDWTLVKPVVLKEGDASPVKEYGETGKGTGMFSGITRASVAKFMVKAAEVETWSKKAVVVAN